MLELSTGHAYASSVVSVKTIDGDASQNVVGGDGH